MAVRTAAQLAADIAAYQVSSFGATTAAGLRTVSQNIVDSILALVSEYSASNNLGIGPGTATQPLELFGNLALTGVAVPSAPTAALAGAGAGNLSNGAYTYKVTFTTAAGETNFSASGSVTVVDNTTNGKVTVTFPVSTDVRVTGRKIYRTKVGTTYPHYLVATIANNTATTTTDNTADSGLSGGINDRGNTTLWVYNGSKKYGLLETNNTGIGQDVFNALTTGIYNVAFGQRALDHLTTGRSNTCFGGDAGTAITTGEQNVAAGEQALYKMIDGGNNTAIGRSALGQAPSGSSNIAIGAEAINTAGTKSNNVAIGYQSGNRLTTGGSNVFLGHLSGTRQTTNSNLLIIDNQDRTTDALEATNALLYGVFAAAPANQLLCANVGVFRLGNGETSATPASPILQGTSASGTNVATGTVYIAPGQSTGTGTPGSVVVQSTTTTTSGSSLQTLADTLTVTAGKVGIGTTSPRTLIHGIKTTEQLRLGYDDSNYLSITVGSTGSTTFSLTGTTPTFTFSQAVASTQFRGPEFKTDTTTPTDMTVTTGAAKTLVLATPVYDDLKVTPTAFDFVGSTDPTLVDYTPTGSGSTTKLYEFAKNDVGYFVVQLPHTYKLGTDISAHIHWTPGQRGTAESGKYVGWKLVYTWANIDGTFPAMATLDLSDACDGTNDKHQMTPAVVIDGHTASKGISSMLICHVTRTDTGADDDWVSTVSGQLPFLLEVDFHFEIDTMGSRQIGTK